MGKNTKKINANGSLILNQIDFKQVFYCKVTKSNETSSKVYLPKHLEGKYVYVIVDEKKG